MATRPVRWITLAACLLALPQAAAAFGPKYEPKGRPVDYKGHFSTFPSGMRLVVYELPHVDRFVVSVSYGAGSVDDPAGKEGLAHLVEHLAFRAAPDGAASPRIWGRLVASGMRFNASTVPDHTDYWIAGKPAELGEALRIEAARMSGPLAGVSEDEFAIERDVVIAEWRERYETYDAASWQWIRELAFPGHPYGRVSGTPATLKTISLADARAWTKARYDPAGVVMVVVSPFPAEDAARYVSAAFGPLIGDAKNPRKPIAREPPKMPGPPARADGIPTRSAPVKQAELWVAWPVPGTYAVLEPMTYAVTTLLHWHVGYRLNQLALQGVVDRIDLKLHFMDGAGLVAVKVVLRDASKAGKVLEAVRFAASELRLPNDFANVEAIRSALLVRSYLQLEDPSATEISTYVRATGNPDYLGNWSKRVAVQLSHDVDGFGDKWFGGDRSAALLVVPDRNIRAHDLAPGPAQRSAYVDPLEDEAAGIAPPPPERLAAVLRAPGLANAERRTLENGLQVAFLQHGSLPVANVRVALRTPAEGSAGAALGAPLLALTSSTSWLSLDVRNQLQFGLDRKLSLDVDSLLQVDRGSSGNLPDILETEARWAGKGTASFSGPTFDQAKKVYARFYETVARDPLERVRRALNDRLFPGHPYGAPVTAAAIGALSSGQASGWLDGAIRPQRATLLVVSDVAPSPEGWKWIEDEFGGWKRGTAGPVPAAPTAPVPAGRSAVLVERRGATQATVAVAFRVPTIGERDAPALEAVRWLLQSRLQQRIRVEEGVSYGVSVALVDHRQAAALQLVAVVDPEAAGRTVKTILAAAQELAAAPLPRAAAARARWKVARDFAGRFDTVADAADGLETIALHGLPPDYWDRMPPLIESLDAARIQAAAKALALGHEVVVVSADRAIVPQLTAAGLAPEILAEPAE